MNSCNIPAMLSCVQSLPLPLIWKLPDWPEPDWETTMRPLTKVGEKTAAKWINRFGSLDGLLARVGEDPKIFEKLDPHRELVLRNRKMVELVLDLPLPEPISGFSVAPRYPELIRALKGFEFRSLSVEVERDASAAGLAGIEPPPQVVVTATPPSQGELFA